VAWVTNAPTASQSLAEQVRTLRKRRNLTLNQLSELCEKLGAPQLTFSALANIERGATAESKRRPREVNVDELMVLARALQVPPVLLLFQIGTAAEVELTPGLVVTPWDAAKWWSGEEFLQGDEDTWWSIPVYLHKSHDRLVTRFGEILADRLFADPPAGVDQTQRQRETDQLIYDLREVRRQMRANGLTPPVLDADMAFIDERRHAPLQAAEVEARIAAGELIRVVDPNRPGAGKPMAPGDATKLEADIARARAFVEEYDQRQGGEE
jgi:transcriptional regulator with XRE-family HTH domain